MNETSSTYCHSDRHIVKSILGRFMAKLGNHSQFNVGAPHRVMRGVYSNGDNYNLLCAYLIKYKQAVVTLETAMAIYDMTDEFVTQPYSLAYMRGSRKITDSNIKQHFVSSSLIRVGARKMKYEGMNIIIYDKERLLIDILRFKKQMAPSIYKEAIYYYRELVQKGEFDYQKFKSYASHFPNNDSLRAKLVDEIM